ncbi:hypothetical protein [Rhodococcus sp. IEGM 1318]|uniref:hypothetical protein n=1 Tax=Rhodococcus sp. IEGM 1318 TaxID=3082226 RepID=UPI002953926B|nr:hypothetical protein [Rhodococcus sp. IEGM 1318]MDV8008596.1 hypothetical protein [Rhodococcus sp. IEGM 1318]
MSDLETDHNYTDSGADLFGWKIRKLLTHALDRLPEEDRAVIAAKPGMRAYPQGESVEFRADAMPDRIIAVASAVWLYDDTDCSFEAEWVPTDDITPDMFD